MAITTPASAVVQDRSQRAMIWMPSKHMGNLLVSLRAISSLIEHYGEDKTTLVISSAYREIIDAAGITAKVIYFPHGAISFRQLWSFRQLISFCRQVRAVRADIAIALEADTISQKLLPLCHAKSSLAPDRTASGKPPHSALRAHRFFIYADIAKAITGREPDRGYPQLRPSPVAIASLELKLSQLDVNPMQPLAVIHPGATKVYKQWPVSYFAELAGWLESRGFQTLVTGAGVADGEIVEQFKKLADKNVVSLHDSLSIAELVALFHRASVFIGNDTGPTHLAAATKTPVAAIFGPTNELRWGPLGENVRIVRNQTPCLSNCSRGSCDADYQCMKNLKANTVEEILTEMDIQTATRNTPQPLSHSAHPVLVTSAVPTVIHVFKRYNGNYPLLNAMVSTTPGKYRTLVCYLSGSDDNNNGVEALGVKTIYLNLDKQALNWRSLNTLRALRDIIDREQCDLLACQFRGAIAIGAIAAHMSSAKPAVLGILHGIVGGGISLSEKILNAAITPLMVGWVSVSRDGMEEIYQHNINIPRHKIFHVQNGLDYSRFLAPRVATTRNQILDFDATGKRVYLVVSRLSVKKNHQRIIDAFQRLVKTAPDSALVIVGTGPLEDELKAQVNALGLASHIHFLGFRKDIDDIMRASDVFLMPSLREGLPLALLEAMASSLPVVTSDINGIREVVAGIDCGWLVNPCSTDAIAEALHAASQLPSEQLNRMGQKGKERVLADFRKEKMVDNYERLFDLILSQHKKASNGAG